MLYQSTHDASQSCAQHAEIVAALKKNDRKRAAQLMADHIGYVEAGLTVRVAPEPDPLQGLRDLLSARRDPPRANSSTRASAPVFPSELGAKHERQVLRRGRAAVIAAGSRPRHAAADALETS